MKAPISLINVIPLMKEGKQLHDAIDE